MKKIVLGVLSVAVLAIGIAYWAGLIKFNVGANAGICQLDDAIAPPLRSKVDQTAMAFVHSILQGNPTAAYVLMTQAAQNSTTASSFSAEMNAAVKRSAPFADTKISHTYFINDSGGGPDTRTICGFLAHNDWVAVADRPGLDQAHVLISSRARNNDWAFTLWLLPVGDDWQVQYFHMGISSIVGLTPETLIAKARHEKDIGHLFNATMLYAAANSTLDRGNTFQLGVTQTLHEDLAKFVTPTELSGKPPMLWAMNGESYPVSQVSVLGVQGALGLIFFLPQKVWKGNDDADQRNRAFINGFVQKHPEYASSFKFLVARALKPDNSGGFGTVYQNGTGFLKSLK